MLRACTLAFFAFLVLYVLALAVLAVGTFGWFGAERDPLSGVYLLPLGLPWNLLAGEGEGAALPWIGLAAPLLNLLLIGLLCRTLRRRAHD